MEAAQKLHRARSTGANMPDEVPVAKQPKSRPPSGIREHILERHYRLITGFTKIPAWKNATLAEHWPPENNSREAPSGYHVKNEAGTPPPGEPGKPCFPLIIFSRGLGGTRTTYSSLCGEFASYGFVVVSLEYRDGSGPRTYINLSQREQEANTATVQVDISDEDRKRGFSKMDYVFPKGNARDPMPGNEQGVDAELRAAQIQLRLAEIEEAHFVMTLIHEGNGDDVTKANLRNKDDGFMGGSSRGLKGVDWKVWQDRFHLQETTMIGHSFGAATTVEVLRHKDRFLFFSQGIIYDIWGAAIQPPEDDLEHRIHSPLLGINSEAFMAWPENFKSVMSLCKEAKEQDALVWLMTVRGSVHISQSGFSILYPKVSSILLKMTVNSRRAIDLNINASLEFLREVMPKCMSEMNRGTNEHLLEVCTPDELPTEKKPEPKWTAVRLRIPHELKIRSIPAWIRRYARKKKMTAMEQNEPRDPNGKLLEGLEDINAGEEVWMHACSSYEERAAKTWIVT